MWFVYAAEGTELAYTEVISFGNDVNQALVRTKFTENFTGPVSAAAYDKVHFGFVFFGFLVGIFWFLCGIDNDFITAFVS